MRSRTTFYTLLLSGCLLHLSAAGQKLTKTEKKILEEVEENYPASVQFLEKSVNINSGTFNPEGVKKVGAVYQEMLEEMGFKTKWVDMPGSMNRGGHLIGEIKGKKGKKLLLIGHLDTVFEPGMPFQKWEQKGDVATGPGANDMKGGNMVLLYALKALHEEGQLKGRQITVIFHGDEENPGRPYETSRKDIVDIAKRSDIALGFETGTGFNYATVARRGSSSWTLKVKGKQAHSSGVFSERVGAGAVYEASRILYKFYEELQDEYLTYNPGLVLGGTEVSIAENGTQGSASGKTNLVANMVVVKGDLRFLTNEQLEETRQKMKAIVAESLPQTSAEITFDEGYPPMPPTEGNMALLQVLNKVSQDLGHGEVKPYDPGKRGAGDISFVAQYIDGLDGLGALGGGAHAPEEYIDLKTLQDIEKRTALLIYRLSSSK
ncbi:M20/M25/M40 family metallo-hydrolase [Pontibacter cellulosilyticus]|uniref:M20/M25/M40 family metallo-hydrolase n=1 Tax=Pontibacter cellulosilyticus TaxID=1720253 RepID=A0A923N3S1_9BACT|nr:M20/M25/M40 family metallo-hydrolase [Pontibacter cellulosilyticus]MBC5991334.1 M20/M25/M40 family metallo-hydrolase [Pontibacter cellulosilyticus]